MLRNWKIMKINIDRSCQKCGSNRLKQIEHEIQLAWNCIDEGITSEHFLGYADPAFIAVDVLFYWDGSDTEYARIQDFLDTGKYDYVGIILYPGFYLLESNMLGEGFYYPFKIPDPQYFFRSHHLDFLIFDQR
jgi:hypothetical protein